MKCTYALENFTEASRIESNRGGRERAIVQSAPGEEDEGEGDRASDCSSPINKKKSPIFFLHFSHLAPSKILRFTLWSIKIVKFGQIDSKRFGFKLLLE